ncbi:argininosuccinate synthase [Candidatus Protochlamydia phocaeensis]|uniref:argininosuccinate synthase n=1 Tax=Candidatus Protochlamydia phocaeensis TaxID=1414722 RepID=UPI000838D7DF|nr:argininosuccinate synthase [Candidatus Protochlamydia phocaeensis]
MKKVILAYSGGLDTSIILKWLLEQGLEVICFLANVGQKEDFALAKEKALKLGASRVYIEDLRQEFVEGYIFQALKANAMYEGRYLLGTSLSRPLIAKKQVEIAKKEQTTLLAHGATGKGNDQVRFEMTYLTLMPNAEIISPWKDLAFLSQFKGRTDMIAYAQTHGIPITSTLQKPYSMDENLMHTSYEGGVLEDPSIEPPEDMFQQTASLKSAPDEEEVIAIEFAKGVPISVTNLSNDTCVKESAVAIFTYLNALCGKHGIGRIDIVENRFVGMKSRGVYETPAGSVLWKAHLDLEPLVLDREVFLLKEMWMPKIAQLIYNGFWFSPEMEFLMAAIEKSQERVEGKVYLKLYKGNAVVLKRESPQSLYDQKIASMDQLGGYDQTDAKGFIKLNALRLKAYNSLNKGI